MADNKRIVLAYSGGLDTSVAISYLKERTGKDVVAVSLDVGQGGESLETIKQRALACGAVESYVVDARDEFANEYCMKALKANAMYEGVYPLVKDCYSYTDDPAFPPVEDEVVIEFKEGVPVKIDGRDVTPLQAIEEMNRRAGAQGVGRIDLIEDRLVGIKSRELYEAPGAVALITAHQELENCCLEREQHRIKRDIDKRWGELVYDAQWFSPATQSLNAFIEDTQKYVSGEIRMVLHGGRAVVTGRRSDSSLYDYKLATYDSGDTFDQKSSNGFIDIYGLPSRVAAARDVKFGNGIEVPENTVE